ncbi:MAG TPA: addiction module protein [Candidatus Binatia bacterium]|nr:addiction module protein [Candidatus Binatia bacterium]
MSKSLPLKEMTLHEKMAVMESLWEDLAGSSDPIESPAWHKEILDQRWRRISEGEAQFIDWQAAKVEIRKKLE